MTSGFQAYTEPSIITILVYTSFFILLNVTNFLFNFIGCGLVAQILIGVAYGNPGGGWLPDAAQNTIREIGYIGLILIVYEGGLATDLRALWTNLYLSILVASIGICAPIGLSFTLRSFANATKLQAFTAGAALCSTSLGTILTVLETSGLGRSRLGVILTNAAMLDDVVGLIMVQVISNLNPAAPDVGAVTIIRPIGVSLAFAVCTPVICIFASKGTKLLSSSTQLWGKLNEAKLATLRRVFLCVNTLILLGFVTGSTYAGTSNLFAAYIAGISTAWLQDTAAQSMAAPARSDDPAQMEQPPSEFPSSAAVFIHYYKPVMERFLKPCFFASIGFSIPFRELFVADVAWRGIIYAALMVFGKLLCGLVLLRLYCPTPNVFKNAMKLRSASERNSSSMEGAERETGKTQPQTNSEAARSIRQARRTTNSSTSDELQLQDMGANGGTSLSEVKLRRRSTEAVVSGNDTQPSPAAIKPLRAASRPRSLYPAILLGSAMVARGEIGLLISSIAESKGDFGNRNDSGSSQLFLIVTWAILICTIAGPFLTGLLVKRVRRLQRAKRQGDSAQGDPLGVWGFQ